MQTVYMIYGEYTERDYEYGGYGDHYTTYKETVGYVLTAEEAQRACKSLREKNERQRRHRESWKRPPDTTYDYQTISMMVEGEDY